MVEMIFDEFRDRKANGYRLGEYRRVLYDEEIQNAIWPFLEKKMPYKVLDEKRSQDFKHAWNKQFVKKKKASGPRLGQLRIFNTEEGRKKGYRYLWEGLKQKRCLQGEEALNCLDMQEREQCFVHFPVIDLTILIKKADLLDLENIHDMTDVVLADEKMTWTFVKTHEKGLGPYFVA